MDKRSEFIRTCAECGTEFDIEGVSRWKIDFDGKELCEDCAANTPRYTLCDVDRRGSRHFAFANLNLEEVSTNYYPTKEEAEKNIVRLCRKLWDRTPYEEEG